MRSCNPPLVEFRCFFFNDTATTEIYTLSLHDALPIYSGTPVGEPVVVRGSAADLFATVYPATLAHELQHLLNFAHRCVQRPCEGPEETWINEALSKVAEDLAGYGWNVAGGRAEGAAYLGHPGAELRGYDGRSLTRWEGDPIGSYPGAPSVPRLFTDRAGGPHRGRDGRSARPGGGAGHF